MRRAHDRGVDVVFGCDIPCSIASDTLGQLRVMFNVQGFLDGAMERSFATVVGRRPAVRPGMPLLTPRKLIETATITAAAIGAAATLVPACTVHLTSRTTSGNTPRSRPPAPTATWAR